MNEREHLVEVAVWALRLTNIPVILPSPEAHEAHERLCLSLKNWQDYIVDAATSDTYVKTKRCERCGVEIFFAQLPTHRWVPLETEPVDASGVIPSWRFVPDFTGRPITVDVHQTKASGDVWIDHRQTCGVGDGPRHRCPAYVRRHKINCERADERNASVAVDLQAMMRRLEDQ